MDAVGVLLIGVGAWLMYEAWRNKNPTPILKAKSTLTAASVPTSVPATTTVA